jgi:general secretion pathway protein G
MTRSAKCSMLRSGNAGFTLIEVLLVVAILGILAGVVVSNLGGRSEAARIEAARASISGIVSAVDVFQLDTGRLPTALDELINQPSGVINWNGPYLRGGLPADPWGSPFGLRREGNTYQVVSAGPDQQMGTPDDITSW